MTTRRLSDLLETRRVSLPEGIAVVLATAAAIDARRATGVPWSVPGPEDIVINSRGQIALGRGKGDQDDPAGLARLLTALLRLDTDSGERAPVHGGVLLVIAHALGRIDLPPMTPQAFRSALQRFGSSDPAIIAALARDGVAEVPVQPGEVAAPAADAPGTDRAPRPPVAVPPMLAVPVAPSETYRPAPVRGSRGPSLALSALAGALGAAAVIALVAWNDPAVDPSLRTAPETAAVATGTTGADLPVASGPTTSEAASAAMPSGPAEPSAAPATTPATPASAEAQSVHWTAAPLVARVAVGAEAFSPSFVGRESTLVFHAGRAPAPLMRARLNDAGAMTAVATVIDDGAANYHVTASPDGQWLAYDSDKDGVRGVYVARADGSGARLVSGRGHAAVPRWAPDGKTLAFVRPEPNRPRVWNLWTVNVADGSLRRITQHDVGQPWGASWFADGHRIAYSIEQRLVILDLSTGRRSTYRTPVAGRLVRTPAVSPDGNSIVFQVFRDGVWLLDLPSSTMRRILEDRTAEEFAWSADGGEIAFHSRRGGAWELWRLRRQKPAVG